MVDLDSDPTKLIEVVEIGKQLLMTRGALNVMRLGSQMCIRDRQALSGEVLICPRLRLSRSCSISVSYTHLDVYKRQQYGFARQFN